LVSFALHTRGVNFWHGRDLTQGGYQSRLNSRSHDSFGIERFKSSGAHGSGSAARRQSTRPSCSVRAANERRALVGQNRVTLAESEDKGLEDGEGRYQKRSEREPVDHRWVANFAENR